MKHAGALLATALMIWAFPGSAQGQQIHRNGFETRETAWLKGTADTPFNELVHDVTDSMYRSGQYSEHLQITSQQGNSITYYYPTAKAPINDDLVISLWLRANRPGVQLMARLVLPKERNPNNLDEPLTTILRGDLGQESSRWQRMEVRRPANLARQQQQLMRAKLQRDVDFTDAYIDRLILNVYCGQGFTEIWIDDLEIGPVLDTTPFQATSRQTGPVKLLPPGESPQAVKRTGVVELARGQLRVNDRLFFFRGIRHSDTPLRVLREAGFNTLWFDRSTAPATVEEAVNRGFWLIPLLPTTDEDPQAASAENIQREINRFLERDAVLFWDLGGGLTEEQTSVVSQGVRLVHAADPQRPVGADAWDGLQPYSLSLDLLGVHRWPLMTGLELPEYRRWLNQRRLLARAGVFLWTWVQTHLPDWYTSLVYDRPAIAAFDEPIGPQPEQIRLLTYLALSAGCRGLGFWSDRFLADSHYGRDRLLTLGLLNQELRMLEPLLLSADEPGTDDASWIGTSKPDVRAAVLRTKKGLLVMPIWVGKGSQFVPGQSAVANLTLTVPQVPVGTEAWEISPAEVRCLHQERVIGGTKITVPEFGLTTAVIFTSDNGPNGIVVRLQEQVRQSAKLAAQWAAYLAEEELSKVGRVQEQLVRLGHPLPDGEKLMEDARKRSRASVDLFNKGNYREAYAEAERALRPLRILMRAQWDDAVKELQGLPVASPYAVSFYTLPRHLRFMELVHQGRPGTNVLPNGDFELAPDRVPEGWTAQETTLDDVVLTARRVPDEPKEGKQCLMLKISPKNPQLPPPAALERTYLAINSPSIRLQPGTIVRISGWIRIPGPITASVDGVLLYDSAGGEPLAVRLTEATKWKQFVLYRRVPSSGSISVTLALTGLGAAYFDDIRIEPLLWNSTASASNRQ
jgi:hypothetical protein